MRVLLVLRGAQGAGKSTWIKNNNLERYTISSDNIRLLLRSPVLKADGTEGISQNAEKETWDLLTKILRDRMSIGEFIVVDSCASKTRDINRFKQIAEENRYRIFLVDFSKTPLEVLKERNSSREEFRKVPDEVLEEFFRRMNSEKVPGGVKVLDPEKALEDVLYRKDNFDRYDEIMVIGDIHGSNDPLQKLLNDGIKDNALYIFLGDYLDRGVQNKDVLEFLLSIYEKENVILLEGNHERHIFDFVNGNPSRYEEFNRFTLPQIEGIERDKIKKMLRKLRQCVYFQFNGQDYLCTHAGIPTFRRNLIFEPTINFVKGVGEYEDIYTIQKVFEEKHPEIIQINGHRNPQCLEMKQGNSYNLESQVELGGDLSAILIKKDAIEEIKIHNKIFDSSKKKVNQLKYGHEDVREFIRRLRSDSRTIKEKEFGNISSFNFSKDVFFNKTWNPLTTRARGLFIDTENFEIANRSYNKFFNIGERRETEMDILEKNLKFPIDVYLKYNGFLGMLGYDSKTDNFLFSSKSSIEGPYVGYFRDIFMKSVSNENRKSILKFIKENNVSFIFEVIDPGNDPHIIKYNSPHIVLLDIIKRDINFVKYPYEELKTIAESFGLSSKERIFTLENFSLLKTLVEDAGKYEYNIEGEHIEGFVIEDSNGYMTKLKTGYYNYWKYLRGVIDDIFRLNSKGIPNGKTKKEIPEDGKEFFEFLLKALREGKEYCGRDLIKLRDQFFKEEK